MNSMNIHKGQTYDTNGQDFVSNAQMPNMTATFSQDFSGFDMSTPGWEKMMGSVSGMDWGMTPTAERN